MDTPASETPKGACEQVKTFMGHRVKRGKAAYRSARLVDALSFIPRGLVKNDNKKPGTHSCARWLYVKIVIDILWGSPDVIHHQDSSYSRHVLSFIHLESSTLE